MTEPTGLVDRVVAAEDLDTEAAGFAAVLVSRSQLTIRSVKESVNALLAGESADASKRCQETISSGELAEGVAAFLEKRPPAFPWS